jgi:hypothetical protein
VLQDILVEKDFNIVAEAPGVVTPVIKKFNASVIENILEIRFYWAGKGTTRIPAIGAYGPLISAISVDPSELILPFNNIVILIVVILIVILIRSNDYMPVEI